MSSEVPRRPLQILQIQIQIQAGSLIVLSSLDDNGLNVNNYLHLSS